MLIKNAALLALPLSLLVVACSDDDPAPSTGAPTNTTTTTCTSALETLMKPVDSTSMGAVSTISEADGAKTLFVDATAGGAQAASTNPRVYINLETGTRVDVTDKSAAASTGWDLAIKRPVLFTNSGNGGTGQGGAAKVAKDFDAVTAADAPTFTPESFVTDACEPKVDQTNAMKTSFDGWYDYDQATNVLTPAAGTWIVKGATGKLFKVQILGYYSEPDGSKGQAGGRYSLKVKAL